MVRSWSGLECGARQVAELIMGMSARLRPQPDGALACRQHGLAYGVNRRRGHHGKSFTRSHRPRRRHLCQRPRYLPPPARLLCAADSVARSPAAHMQLADVEVLHAPPGRMPVPPKTAQPAYARAPAHRDRARAEVALRVLRARLRHLADQHHAGWHCPPGASHVCGGRRGAAGRQPCRSAGRAVQFPAQGGGQHGHVRHPAGIG